MNRHFAFHLLFAVAACAAAPSPGAAQHPGNVVGRVQKGRQYKFVPGERPQEQLFVQYRMPSGKVASARLAPDGTIFVGHDAIGYYPGSGNAVAINDPYRMQQFGIAGSELVYEYRSGMLIEGILTLDRNGGSQFFPRAGSKVIEFKDYPMGKDSLRIYNLPGKFVLVDDKPKGGKPGPKE